MCDQNEPRHVGCRLAFSTQLQSIPTVRQLCCIGHAHPIYVYSSVIPHLACHSPPPPPPPPTDPHTSCFSYSHDYVYNYLGQRSLFTVQNFTLQIRSQSLDLLLAYLSKHVAEKPLQCDGSTHYLAEKVHLRGACGMR